MKKHAAVSGNPIPVSPLPSTPHSTMSRSFGLTQKVTKPSFNPRMMSGSSLTVPQWRSCTLASLPTRQPQVCGVAAVQTGKSGETCTVSGHAILLTSRFYL